MKSSITNPSLRHWLNQKQVIDTVQLYLAKGVIPHPLLEDHFIELMQHQEQMDQVCLIPSTIFQIFHNRLKKAS